MRVKSFFIITICLALFLGAFINVPNVNAAITQVRYGGTDRYETAIKISENNFSSSDYAVLVQGEDFADALSATPLAKKMAAPILLVRQDGLDDNLLEELKRLKVKNIIIIGGTGVISQTIEQQLAKLSYSIKRYGGTDRYDTSAQVAYQIGAQNGAVIVSGNNFPDAISIASVAGEKQLPILLVATNNIPDKIQQFIDVSVVSKFYVIGGTGVISDVVMTKLSNAERISGNNRYETNLAVINKFNATPKTIFLASGQNFPDALSGSVVAALSGSPVILVNGDEDASLNYANNNLSTITDVKIFGGNAAVTDSTAEKFLNPNLYVKKVLGYSTYYYYGAKESYDSLVNNYNSIDEIATDTFSTDSTGNLIASKGYNTSGGLVDLIPTNQITFASSKGIPAYAMITNGFSADIARTLLRSPVNVQNLINNTLDVLKNNNYSGVNVDIEGIYASDREYFTSFITQLSTTIKSRGYGITIAVPAKTKDSLTDSWSGGYDYNAISSYVDQMVIMTYDEHWSGGTAGPIASINWVENVIKYAITVVPKNKILVGLASYGYDWAANGTSKAYSVDQANSVAKANNATINFDDISKCPNYSYTSGGIQHNVWFENAQSIGYKIDLVNSYNLGGVAVWSLGQTNSDYWNMISLKLNKANK